jgi:hypothetical protein
MDINKVISTYLKKKKKPLYKSQTYAETLIQVITPGKDQFPGLHIQKGMIAIADISFC